MIVERYSFGQNTGRSVSDNLGGVGQTGILFSPAFTTKIGGRHVFASEGYRK